MAVREWKLQPCNQYFVPTTTFPSIFNKSPLTEGIPSFPPNSRATSLDSIRIYSWTYVYGFQNPFTYLYDENNQKYAFPNPFYLNGTGCALEYHSLNMPIMITLPDECQLQVNITKTSSGTIYRATTANVSVGTDPYHWWINPRGPVESYTAVPGDQLDIKIRYGNDSRSIYTFRLGEHFPVNYKNAVQLMKLTTGAQSRIDRSDCKPIFYNLQLHCGVQEEHKNTDVVEYNDYRPIFDTRNKMWGGQVLKVKINNQNKIIKLKGVLKVDMRDLEADELMDLLTDHEFPQCMYFHYVGWPTLGRCSVDDYSVKRGGTFCDFLQRHYTSDSVISYLYEITLNFATMV